MWPKAREKRFAVFELGKCVARFPTEEKARAFMARRPERSFVIYEDRKALVTPAAPRALGR
jgi:hypothetical protein